MLQRTNLWLSQTLLLVLLLPADAAQSPVALTAAVTDPAQAGPDFAVQGDWVGTAPYKGKDVKYGVQIIALGDGKFHGVGFYGGLPGDGWDNKTKLEADGESKDGQTIFTRNDSTSTYKDGAVTIRNKEGKELCVFHKVRRTSPTLAPSRRPARWCSSTAPRPTSSYGRMTPDGLLMEATSKQKFQSYTIHLEFLIPFEPTNRGQGRGNSGYYAQGATKCRSSTRSAWHRPRMNAARFTASRQRRFRCPIRRSPGRPTTSISPLPSTMVARR